MTLHYTHLYVYINARHGYHAPEWSGESSSRSSIQSQHGVSRLATGKQALRNTSSKVAHVVCRFLVTTQHLPKPHLVNTRFLSKRDAANEGQPLNVRAQAGGDLKLEPAPECFL